MKVKRNRTEYMVKYWKEQGKIYKNRQRMSLFEFLGGPVCKKCGFSDIRALQIDHVNGGGSKARKEGKGVNLKQLKMNQNAFQVLCANCNWIKRFENNEATGRGKSE